MPTYLCHGFRWHRPGIRTFVMVQNLDDVSPDWIARPGTTRALIDTFYKLFPFLPKQDVEADAEAEAAAALAAQKEAAQKAIAAAAAAEERGRQKAEAAALAARSKSKSRKDKKVKEAKETKDTKDTTDEAAQAAAMPPIIPNSPGANAFLAAVSAMRANIEATPPGKCPMPVIPANFPLAEQPGVAPDGVVRRSDGRGDLLALQDHSCIKLLEEYDSDRLGEWTRPHAYLADYVTRIDLSVSIVDEMARYERLQQQRWRREAKSKDGHPSMAGPADEGPAFSTLGGSLSGGISEGGRANTLTKKKKTPGWLEIVRDQLQRGEEIRWYIVVNNDEKRSFGDDVDVSNAGSKATGAQTVAQEEDEEEEDDFVEAGSDGNGVAKRNLEAERERERRRLRFELTGDPDILIDDLSEGGEDVDDDDVYEDDEDESRPGTAIGHGIGNGMTPSASNNTVATSNTYSTAASDQPKANIGRPRGTTITSTATNTTTNTDNTPMVFPLPPQQETRRPHTSAAPNGQINASFLSDFPSPPQLVLSSPSRQLPQRQSQTPNFSTPHSPAPPQQIPPMPPIPMSPPVSPTPPQLRSKKSFDLRPKSSGGGGFRRLFGRSKQQEN